MTEADPVPGAADIFEAARALVASAFRTLAADRVIPTSRYHPWIQAGRDYAGPSIMSLPEFRCLEEMLNAAYPSRFSEPRKRRHAEFANHYLLHLIEASVRRCADEPDYHPDSEGVTQSINEMLEVLEAPHHKLAVVRAMSHIATARGQAVTIDGIEVVPERSRDDFDFFLDQCRARIPGGGGAFNRERPHVFAHPHAVLATSAETGQEPDVFGTLDRASHQLDRFVLLLRLLTGTTARSHFDMHGPVTIVGAVHPYVRNYRAADFTISPFVRRTATIDASFDAPIRALGAMLDSVEIKRKDMAAASLDVALVRYTSSFASDGLAAVVDLATTLEAVFIDEADNTEGVTARLRHRAAALLATQDDPTASVFDDVGAFYNLRSTLVHGGNLSEKTLKNKILGITTVTEKDMFGIAAAEAVDRMRDLVRRAILARLCLASGEQPLWPFNPRKSVDVAFADDERRDAMRRSWRRALVAIGAEGAADSLGPPGQVMVEDYGDRA